MCNLSIFLSIIDSSNFEKKCVLKYNKESPGAIILVMLDGRGWGLYSLFPTSILLSGLSGVSI